MPVRAVIDNNVLVSAALFVGVPQQAVDKVLLDGILIVSIQTLEELTEVMHRRKFDRYLPLIERQNFIRNVIESAELVRITQSISVCRDAKDNMLLELAVSGGADYLITGDQDLLVLNPFRGVETLTPKEFLDKAG